MSSTMDEAAAVRTGEAIDAERLGAYLREQAPELVGAISVKQFPSGYSNLTYLVAIGEREFVLRRPPFGANIKSAHDMGREYRILTALAPVYAKAPRPLLYCADPAVIGAPLYMMARVRGVILRNRLPAGVTLAPGQMRAICDSLVDTLVELHAVDYAAAGLAELGKPEGYVARQVQGWAQRYERAQTGTIPEMAWTGAWLGANLPGEHAAALIHNDYKLDNLVLDPADLQRVIAVLDWEMATIGDPLMDLGTTLGYWMQPGDAPELQLVGLSSFPGALRRSEVAARYAAHSGRDVSGIVYYYVFGLFKIAVIAQQIYHRFRQGLTQDARFSHLDQVVAACARTAQQAATTGKLEV